MPPKKNRTAEEAAAFEAEQKEKARIRAKLAYAKKTGQTEIRMGGTKLAEGSHAVQVSFIRPPPLPLPTPSHIIKELLPSDDIEVGNDYEENYGRFNPNKAAAMREAAQHEDWDLDEWREAWEEEEVEYNKRHPMARPKHTLESFKQKYPNDSGADFLPNADMAVREAAGHYIYRNWEKLHGKFDPLDFLRGWEEEANHKIKLSKTDRIRLQEAYTWAESYNKHGYRMGPFGGVQLLEHKPPPVEVAPDTKDPTDLKPFTPPNMAQGLINYRGDFFTEDWDWVGRYNFETKKVDRKFPKPADLEE
jgi:hypothetical protein